MADLAWPNPDDCTLIGKRVPRLDGPDKCAGRAKYTYDINRPRMLWAKFATCPFGRARVKSIDIAPAETMAGVVAVEVIAGAGTECKVAFQEVAVVAAESEEIAREAARRIKIEWEPLEHNVVDDDVAMAGNKAKAGKEALTEDFAAAIDGAAVISETEVGCSIITHCCLEPHGSVVEVTEVDGKTSVMAWCSSQAVSGVGGEFAQAAGVDAANVHVSCQHMGGGFGSKFGADLWGALAARLSKKTGRPVKVMLERDMELALAGSRPSAFARMRVGVEDDGAIIAWESAAWGSGGNGGGMGAPSLPYVFGNVEHKKTQTTPIFTNTGGARAWRAPNHPQMCLLTMAALSDAAAELGMDELEFVKKNLGLTGRADVYAEELGIAAELIDWKKKWMPRGDQRGVLRRGLGLAMHTWGGGPHDSNVQCTLHPDGGVEIRCGTQDLGVGARTTIGIVAAETFGIPLNKVTVLIGDNRYPASGGSGGSTTVGAISTATRHACVQALNKLCEAVAPEMNAAAEALVAKDGMVRGKESTAGGVPFADACRRIGTQPIVTMGQTQRGNGMSDQGVGGVQMAEVEVDCETGIVTMQKLVAVQDCGRIIDLLTTESQVRGAMIMGVCAALYEERIMDPVTGTLLNPDLEFYKLAGIADVGELVVHMMQTPDHLKRGVIGIGEPPAISPMAAISNAVANAIGARVKRCPMTPDRVLAAMKA
ncbi:MAG: xanthine dehydrogenase family protein molybdopterin-binding subunit [Planctomycetes bacterium]|nr:xanthine dehydrogenase family protein molybdopterin-binding subunit [Planctomycetota bacterium]